ncbi:MAG: signal recognition particle subunit SRP19/SEC65 family protein [Candidatus Bathyarchaeia archaeon]
MKSRFNKTLVALMRKRDKILLWPAYFDLNKTRLQGRRVPKSLAIASPRIEEIKKAAESVGLHPEVVLNVRYPKRPWQKTGYILLPKKGSKTQITRKIAKELVNMRR